MTYEKPQYCNLSNPCAFTILNISLATTGVDTCSATSLILSKAISPRVSSVACSFPKDSALSFAARSERPKKYWPSGLEGNVNMPGVVKPTPIGWNTNELVKFRIMIQ